MNEPIVIPEGQKGYQCEVIADSISLSGNRITSMRWKYPLMVHAEACRHRCFSRSVASNRAIPTERIIAMVEQDPVLPVWWGKAQKGMQADEELPVGERESALATWLCARDDAVRRTRHLVALGLHKQIANRVLMPYQWVTEIVTATDWANFFALRCHSAAQPEMRQIAERARYAYGNSTPQEIRDWHLPLILPEERHMPVEVLVRVSSARCARTSYRTHEGKISTWEEDFALYERLVGGNPKHVSPTEHPAEPVLGSGYWGPLRGWKSQRYHIEGHTVEG